MKKLACLGLSLIALFASAAVFAQEPQLPVPQKEHEWLKQLEGAWETESEFTMEPGKPSIKCKGTETGRLLGGFWVVVEGESEVMGTKINSAMTIGYDPRIKKYVGTWVDSCTNYMWKYEGALNAAGTALTLETEGPSPMDPSKTAKFREVVELKGKDHKSFTSSILGDDGKYTTFMTANARRKGAAPLGSSAAGR